MGPKISMEEIAKMFGVSKVTVSKALNGREGVSEELRIKIKTKAEELGYRINPAARGLKTNKSYNIGIAIPEKYIGEDDSYYFSVYVKIVRAFTELGFSTMFEVIQLDQEKKLIMPDMYYDGKIDGLIIMGQPNDEYLKLYEDASIPVIFFDFYKTDTKVDCVVTDNFYSGGIVTKLLIDKGHKEIGFVGNIYATSSIQDRYLGYCRALLENKLEIKSEYNISDRGDDGNLIELVLPKKMPTAFVCNNDLIAYNLIKLLKEKGYNIPNDISIVSFDNVKLSQMSEPPLTTIDNNVDEMVDVACKVMVKKIENPNKHYNRILIKTKLIERESIKQLGGN